VTVQSSILGSFLFLQLLYFFALESLSQGVE
jgi:hypothetical protein